MTLGAPHDTYPNAETNPGLLAEPTVKRNIGDMLSRLEDEVEADSHSGSNYLSLYMTSTDPESGLSKGLLLVTDRHFGKDPRAAHQQLSGQLPVSYGLETMDCVFIEELSPGNINVKELRWDLRNGPLCRRSEEGLVGLSVKDVIGGKRGWLTRAALAPYFGVEADDLLLSEGNARPADVDEFFAGLLEPGVLDQMQSISFDVTPEAGVS